MQKPTIFFSHSSKDATVLANLKNLINSRTGQAVEIFLSSDGQSVPFGSNWVYKIEEALTDSTIMFVFISPNSINSRWIYFESGFAYSKGADVVPVGILGVNLDQLSPPLSLLQGFNLDKADALGNIIAKINEKYQYNLNTEFSDKEFTQTFSYSEKSSIGRIIEGLNFQIESKDKKDVFPIFESEFLSNKMNFTSMEDANAIWLNGMSIISKASSAMVVIDGLLINENLSLLQEIISKNNLKIKNGSFMISFEEKYILSSESYLRQTALLRDTDIQIYKGTKFVYRGITFRIISTSRSLGPIQLNATIKQGQLTSQWVNEVCRMNLENGVIVIDPNYKINPPRGFIVPTVGLTND